MTRRLLVIGTALVLLLVSGYGVVLLRDRQVCLGRVCVILVPGIGPLVSALQPDVTDPKTGVVTRSHYVLRSVDWIARVEFDQDGDDSYDCREDDCRRESAHDLGCVSMRRDGRWISARHGVRCQSALDAGMPSAATANDDEFWSFGFDRRGEIESECDGGQDSCPTPLECFPAQNFAHVIDRYECHLACREGTCPQGYACGWISHGPLLPEGRSGGVCLPETLH